MNRSWPAGTALLAAALSACGGPPPLVRTPPDAPTRAEYAAALSEFQLVRSAVGRDWMAAGERALAEPLVAAVPFSESGYISPETPEAVGFRLDVRRGRTLVIDLTFDADPPAQVFMDLHEVGREANRPPQRVAEADPGAMRLEYEARRDTTHILRIQPELLRGGRFTVTIRTLASVAFPFRDGSLRAAQSGFGAPRDAGRRSHHGIDLFVPRGTPVLAGADGRVRVDTSDRGGNVIWLRDSARGRNLYYAHLDRSAVDDGAQVNAGDVIGYVGNTGNARTTPPHLHFGVYDRGPTDPYPFLAPADPAPARWAGSSALVGAWARVTRGAAPLRTGGWSGLVPDRTLPAGTAVRVLGGSAGFYRVRLPDGAVGYVPVGQIVAAETPVERLRVSAPALLHAAPAATSPEIDIVPADTSIDILARFNTLVLVRLADARVGWIATP